VGVVLTPALLWAVAERPMAVRIDRAVVITVWVAFVALALFAALSRGFRHRIRWSLGVTTVVTLTLFQWPVLSAVGARATAVIPLGLLRDVVPVAIAVALIWLAARLGAERGFAAILTAAIVLIVGSLTFMAVPYVETAAAPLRGVAATDAPDVVLLIVDAYNRADTLAAEFSFDNQPFLQDLEELGFVVAPEARSNYGHTYASIATMLDLDYVYEPGVIEGSDHSRMRNALSGNPALFDTFRRAGYEIAQVSNAWQGSNCGSAVDVCHRQGLMERSLWSLGQVTILAPLLENALAHPFNTLSQQHLESLPELINADRHMGVPRLTLAHVILPHPPFLLDQACSRSDPALGRPFATPDVSSIDGRRELYVAQLQCTNRLLISSLQEVIARRPDTVVMLTADHGSATTRIAGAGQSWTDAGIEERMNILGAYRLPQCEETVYPTITPVNGTRVITNCALGTSLALHQDRHLWVPPDGDGAVTDVASRLRN
jgi:hypothetical protein